MNDAFVIIPAAGLGTRMGMKKNESKEMLIDPMTRKPVIQWSLDVCKRAKLNFIVIVRKEKKDLISYLNKNNYPYVTIAESRSWEYSIEQIERLWGEKNIILLPDTRFKQSEDILHRIAQFLDSYPVSYGKHLVDDISLWGAVERRCFCEKPNERISGYAWGILGFRRDVGIELLAQMEAQCWFFMNSRSLIMPYFKDITRTGKVEKYERT